MKKLVLIALTVLSANVFAQSSCGTNPTPEFLDQYFSRDRSYLANTGSRDVNAIVYVPVQYHVVGTDAGGGYYSIKDLLAVHCALNQRYAHAQIQFYMYAPPHYIRNTRYYTMSDNNVDRDMKNANNVATVCNIYIVQDCVSGGTTVCGYATFPGFGRQGIVVAKSCSGPVSTTLAHEMGHFFGLPHTFSGWEGRSPFVDPATSNDEKVNGSNCASKGDGFCDTPADFISDRWNCPYTGTKVDFNGDLYNTVLDGTLFMSYSNDACQNKFSLEQEAEMVNTRNTSRSGMNAFTVPSVLVPATTTLVSPANAATSVAPFTSLIWNKVSDATHYHVLMSTSSSFAFNLVVDTIVTDTSYQLRNLGLSTTYYWKILPMTLGATCGNYSATNTLTTAAFAASLVVTHITCPGGNDGALNVTPTGGTPPYTFIWSNLAGYNPITDLVSGAYGVTITDLLGRTMIATIDLATGPSVTIDIVPTGATEITAIASGGNGGPYTYAWSNGTTVAQNSPAAGSVTVTVTDNKGCSTVKTIAYSGINNYEQSHLQVLLYPNPSTNADVLLKIDAQESSDVMIKVYSVNGDQVLKLSKNLIEGENTILLPTAKLSKGVYIVNVSSQTLSKNIQLVIQ